ncbi:MAG: hypothetical protein B7X11_06450, partial [Acidobacteria bacterium 37-65-4]
SPERSWEAGWDGHDQAQLRRFARLPLSQKLEWLEQAQEVSDHLSASRKPDVSPIERGEQ